MEARDRGTTRRSPGRRPGPSETRQAILDAALRAFSTRGFRGASLRAIAADAGVDPALIRHFFGDKASLFAAAVADGSDVVARLVGAFEGGGPDLGRRVADAYLRLWEDPETLAVLRAILGTVLTSPEAMPPLRDMMLASVAVHAPGGAGSAGVMLAASQLLGLAVMRHILQVPALATLDREHVVAMVAPTIDRYLATEAAAG
ncbi:TetR/AcrR family transcriptional regulator [Demequina phytophila]|uniref:TetR/AcrR family transcriptional regulator n=1 Tax=Demequina phytophila TaxID=1638981 RepID=UPI000781274C|nr:TetR family transcriptional regulator [Demequina phytophila]